VIRGAILASFVENPPGTDKPGYGIHRHLGPNLAEAYRSLFSTG
jgi:hypothetical protein